MIAAMDGIADVSDVDRSECRSSHILRDYPGSYRVAHQVDSHRQGRRRAFPASLYTMMKSPPRGSPLL